MGPIGLPEMMALFVIALLLFGPKKLPELGRTLGKGLSEFRRAKNELTATLQSHMNEIERETRIDTPSLTDSSHYTYPYEDHNRYDAEAVDTHREPTPEQHTAIEANAAAADPATHGVKAIAEGDSTAHSPATAPATAPVAGTVPRSNGVQPVSQGSSSHQDALHTVEERQA